LVLVDIRLEKENGLKLARKIKKEYPDIIIAINSNYASPEYQAEAEKVGTELKVVKKMPDKFKKLTIELPVKDYQKLKLIASINKNTVTGTAVEMICKNINEAEIEQKKEVVSDMLKNLGGELIEAKCPKCGAKMGKEDSDRHRMTEEKKNSTLS
jgi:CheY-like chemotaxis protein